MKSGAHSVRQMAKRQPRGKKTSSDQEKPRAAPQAEPKDASFANILQSHGTMTGEIHAQSTVLPNAEVRKAQIKVEEMHDLRTRLQKKLQHVCKQLIDLKEEIQANAKRDDNPDALLNNLLPDYLSCLELKKGEGALEALLAQETLIWDQNLVRAQENH